MRSTRIHPLPPTDSSIAKKKKTVKFSSDAKLRNFTSCNDLHSPSTWLTAQEISSMKMRAKKLSVLHSINIKTRSSQTKTPSKRCEIVYNCHPAHYEILGESLRGMELYTDVSIARRRELLRSNSISIIEEHQNLVKTNRSKLACMYRESTKEAIVHSRKIAEEDASIAAIIMAEDLKQDVHGVASSPSSSSSTKPLSSASKVPIALNQEG